MFCLFVCVVAGPGTQLDVAAWMTRIPALRALIMTRIPGPARLQVDDDLDHDPLRVRLNPSQSCGEPNPGPVETHPLAGPGPGPPWQARGTCPSQTCALDELRMTLPGSSSLTQSKMILSCLTSQACALDESRMTHWRA
jgi:hypothetical protein